jgi:ribose transport system ATP-binding protein
MENSDYLVMRGIRKNFNGTQALKGVDFSARLGEVHAIVGENGAGKSTLIKILAGALQCDTGEIFLGGEPVVLKSPVIAHQLGIWAVYQEFSLVRNLNITENILMGQMPTGKVNGGWTGTAHCLAGRTVGRYRIHRLNVHTPVSRLSVSHQQMVEIAKAAVTRPKVWILDEPSAVLSQEELNSLFALIQRFKEKSTLILYISHRLDEVFKVADRITVLKDGELMGTVSPQDTDEGQLIKMMVGRTLGEYFPARRTKPGDEILAVKGLGLEESFSDISFSLARGEILECSVW